MAFPSEKELKEIREQLSKAEILKYELCKKFVVHIRKNKITQIELAKKLNIDLARLIEIVKYKIHLFTVDKLIEFANFLIQI